MTLAPINSTLSKSRGQIIFEYVLLALCLCVIALRTTFAEAPNIQAAGQPANLSDTPYSLFISTALILASLGWLAWRFCKARFLYRFTAIEIGLLLFCAAALAAGFAASNKRAAVIDFVTLIAPVLMAVLLVQLLDSQPRIKLVLAVIAALGVVCAYQCAYQFFIGNRMMIEQYELAPETMLVPLGIQPGTLQHMLFEHRLYTSRVSGFFTTGNSAGSFAILASFAAVALFVDRLKNYKSDPTGPRRLLTTAAATAFVIFGLMITKSKGAIAASLIAAAMFVLQLFFASWLKAHKKLILIVCVLLAVGGVSSLAFYGLAHGRLPGGNSMLVRWQYWHASARMYADHPLTGVGPGNFAFFYPHYKIHSALETVSDPHSFVFTILTQYGPLGLIGFLAMILVPFWRVLSSTHVSLPAGRKFHDVPFKKFAVACPIIISAALLLIRPRIIPVSADGPLGAIVYAVFTLYITPVIAFVVGFWLFTTNEKTAELTNPNLTSAALFCACLGLLVHNLIDFAIFEPGVLTTFWAVAACLIAIDSRRESRQQILLRPQPLMKVAAVTIALLLICACFYYAFIPAVTSTAKIRQAQQAASAGQFQLASELLTVAADDDALSPTALSLNGRLYLQRFHTSGSKKTDLLKRSEKCLLKAIQRNRADFKNFDRLTEVYTLLAQTSSPQSKMDSLRKAFDSARHAVELYPGCARLHIEMAKIAEQLNQTKTALDHYKEAIDIEDAFRRQFRMMYPDRELVSRLGEENYQFAKQQIEHLSKQLTP